MTTRTDRAVNLTSYIIALPSLSYLLLAILLLGFVFGLFMSIVKTEPLASAIIEGLTLLVLPALLSSILIKLIAWRIPYKRIAATALGAGILYSVSYAVSLLLPSVNPFWAQYVLLIGSALVFVFWWLAARYVFMLKYRSILFACIQLLFYLVLLVNSKTVYVTTEPFLDVAVRFYVSSFTFYWFSRI